MPEHIIHLTNKHIASYSLTSEPVACDWIWPLAGLEAAGVTEADVLSRAAGAARRALYGREPAFLPAGWGLVDDSGLRALLCGGRDDALVVSDDDKVLLLSPAERREVSKDDIFAPAARALANRLVECHSVDGFCYDEQARRDMLLFCFRLLERSRRPLGEVYAPCFGRKEYSYGDTLELPGSCRLDVDEFFTHLVSLMADTLMAGALSSLAGRRLSVMTDSCCLRQALARVSAAANNQ